MANKIPDYELAEAVPTLPEKIGPADLEALNQSLAALLEQLRFARSLPRGETDGRLGAVVALHGAWEFLMRFDPVLAENLHVPLMSLYSALLALNENNIEPILKPTPRTGRAISSPRRYAMMGISVGAAQRLEWTGLSPTAANKAVAAKLTTLGVKPARGKSHITADTLRRWRDQINAVRPLLRSLAGSRPPDIGPEEIGWMNAATNADYMLTPQWEARIRAPAPAKARGFVLRALGDAISKLMLTDPARPPS